MAKQTKEPDQNQDDDRQQLLNGVTDDTAPDQPDSQTETDSQVTPSDESGKDDAPDQGAQASVDNDANAGTLSEFMSSLRSLGWEGEDEDEAKTALLDAYRRTTDEYRNLQQRATEQEELAEYGRQYLRQERERAEAEKSAQQAASEAAPEGWWNPPTFDFSTIEKYRDVNVVDGEPQIGWKKGTPREIIASAEAYQEYLDKWATDLVQRPQEVLPRIIEQEFDRLFEERISMREEEERAQQFAAQIMETNGDWMYTVDNQGRQMLTNEGKRMTELLNQVSRDGVNDPQRQWEMAVALYDYQNRLAASQSDQRELDSKNKAEQRREEHKKKGLSSSGNRNGTVAKPENTDPLEQNPHLSPGRRLVAQLRADGVEF